MHALNLFLVYHYPISTYRGLFQTGNYQKKIKRDGKWDWCLLFLSPNNCCFDLNSGKEVLVRSWYKINLHLLWSHNNLCPALCTGEWNTLLGSFQVCFWSHPSWEEAFLLRQVFGPSKQPKEEDLKWLLTISLSLVWHSWVCWKHFFGSYGLPNHKMQADSSWICHINKEWTHLS